MKIACFLCMILLGIVVAAPLGHTVDFLLVEGVPLQLNRRSCQSRFLALALSHANPVLFPVSNGRDLLRVEEEIRKMLDDLDPNRTGSHEHWRKVVTHLTGNRFELMDESFKTPEKAFNRVREITGASVVPDIGTILPIGSKGVAGLSVSRLGQERYSGHVISVFSVELAGNRLLVSDASTRLDSEGRPVVYGIVTDDLDLKPFEGKYRVYSVKARP